MATMKELGALLRDAGFSAEDVSRHERALRKAGLIPSGADAVTADHFIWLLLALLSGSAKRAREVASFPNSRQTIGDVVLNDGDPEITAFIGLRDILNLRRAGAFAGAGDFRLVEQDGTFVATIWTRCTNGVEWIFTFGPPLETMPRPSFWRLSVASPGLIDNLATLLGPVSIAPDMPLRFVSAAPVPAVAAAQHQSVMVH